MAPNLRLRAATADDIAAIAAVHVEGWRDNYRGMIDDRVIDERTVEWRIAFWSKELQQPNRLTFVAEDERSVVGFACVLVLKPAVEGFDSYLETLYLLSSEKRRGTGRALLRVTADALLQLGCKNWRCAFYDLIPRAVSTNALARIFSTPVSASTRTISMTSRMRSTTCACCCSLLAFRAIRQQEGNRS